MKRLLAVSGALLTLAVLGCSDINRTSTPVALIMTVTSQPISRFDISPAAVGCDQNVATVQIESRVLNATVTNTSLLDVRITRYRVTYTRTDGGHQVPAPFDRSIDFLVTAGSTTSDILFHLADFGDTFNQAPFAALLPQNGGRDPETGLKVVKMNINLQIFGETLAGDRVSASTVIPLDVCFDCGGCQP
jgi:hypothetical protein